MCPSFWAIANFGRYPDLVCRENSHGSLEVLGIEDLDFWTELHKLVYARELLLCYGYELMPILSDYISVSFHLFVICFKFLSSDLHHYFNLLLMPNFEADDDDQCAEEYFGGERRDLLVAVSWKKVSRDRLQRYFVFQVRDRGHSCGPCRVFLRAVLL